MDVRESMPRSIHRAQYILIEAGCLLENAAIHISHSGQIIQIEAWNGRPTDPAIEVVDWGCSIIMPGLINTHTHLELTSFQNQLNKFASFTDWIGQLIEKRKTWTNDDFQASAKIGAHLSLASGTTLVGDISSSSVGWEATQDVPLRRIVFEEILSLSPSRVDPILAQLNQIFERSVPNPLQVHGISPHAPYSVSAELYSRAAEQAYRQGRLLATHVSETKEELQLLLTGTGEFKDFLNGIGALPDDWKPPQLSPIAYLHSLKVLGTSCLLIHCNYLDEDSISRLAQTQSSVVYCPRSHDFFGHEAHPVRQLLDAGIPVALGTDSLASNASLSMMDEMRYLFSTRKDVEPEEIFQAATLSGASALNYIGSLGRLASGYWADMAILELPPNLKPRHILHQILEGAGYCIATVVQGKIVWQKSHSSEFISSTPGEDLL
jgi:cytosine/adenosine deaminase-related metal-dependent hydrolase